MGILEKNIRLSSAKASPNMIFFKDPIYFRITPLSVYITNNVYTHSLCKDTYLKYIPFHAGCRNSKLNHHKSGRWMTKDLEILGTEAVNTSDRRAGARVS